MPPFGPISRRRFIDCLRQAGFDGPYPGGRHQFMARGAIQVRIPNTDIDDRGLLARILNQAGLTREEWEHLE